MLRKPIVGIIGFSDGDPEVHEELKDIVQKQVDVIEEALRGSGQVEVIVADKLVASERDAKEQAECCAAVVWILQYSPMACSPSPIFRPLRPETGKAPLSLPQI